MGPYMRPIPIGSSAAIVWSLAIAFIVTPWAAVRILRWGKKYRNLTEGKADASAGTHGHADHPEDLFTRLYRSWMQPLIAHSGYRFVFLSGIVALLLGAMATVGIGWVKV